MTKDEKILHEAQGLLHCCGCKLKAIGGGQYQISRRGSGEVLAMGNLITCYSTAVYMAGSGKFQPEPVATGDEAYQAGVAMEEKLNQGK